jgi:hypothetical protein
MQIAKSGYKKFLILLNILTIHKSINLALPVIHYKEWACGFKKKKENKKVPVVGSFVPRKLTTPSSQHAALSSQQVHLHLCETLGPVAHSFKVSYLLELASEG